LGRKTEEEVAMTEEDNRKRGRRVGEDEGREEEWRQDLAKTGKGAGSTQIDFFLTLFPLLLSLLLTVFTTFPLLFPPSSNTDPF